MYIEKRCQLATPRTREEIRRDAFLLREKLGLAHEPFFPVVEFIEHVLPITDPTFYLDVISDKDMPGIQAEYVPSQNVMRVRESVYEAAVAGYWWARSTLAHELGHYYYHNEDTVRFATLDPFTKLPYAIDPEQQADTFMAELLAPVHLIRGMSVRKAGKEFGVSYCIAKRQLCILERIKRRHKRKKKRRSSASA